MPNICLPHQQQPDLEVSAAGSSGFQSFTPSVQGVAHVDCGQWLRSGLGPIQASWLGPVTGPQSPPAQGCCWPGDSHPWSGGPCSMGNMCIPHCSLEFFLLQMSRDTRWSCRQAGLTRLVSSSCHLRVWQHRWGSRALPGGPACPPSTEQDALAASLPALPAPWEPFASSLTQRSHSSAGPFCDQRG